MNPPSLMEAARLAVCAVETCDRSSHCRSYCIGHYNRLMKKGDVLADVPLKLKSRGYPTVCSVPGCTLPHLQMGYCKPHASRVKLYGDPQVDKPFQGRAGYVNCDGYREVYAIGHPNAKSHGMILEHRWVMSEHLGRPLTKDETVHHLNGDRADNRIDNLELWVKRQPPGQRVEDRVADAVALLQRYAPELLR